MTLHPRTLTSVPADTAALAAQVVASTSPYRVLGDQLADLFTDIQFAPLYTNHGRAAISPALLALVTVFQFLEQVPDRQAADLVRVRLDWKYALHLPLADPGFDFSVLCYFRRRLLAHADEGALFETVLARIRSLGLIKQRGKQRTDSLAVLGAVRDLTRLETVSETLRLALVALAEAAPGWLEQVVPAAYRETYERSRPDYRLTEAERAQELLAVGEAGFWLVDHLGHAGLPGVIGELAAIQTLRTVWAQRYDRHDGQVRLRAQAVDATALVVSPHDVGVHHGQKRGKAWLGEKVPVTETGDGPDRFLTNVTTANASSVDSAALPTVWDQLRLRDLLPSQQYVDAGYVTGRRLAQSEALGIHLLGPPLADTAPNGLKLAQFQLDWAAKVATCPAGQTSVKWRGKTDRDGSQAVQIQFAAATCATCVLRPQCTPGTSGRSLHVGAYHEWVAEQRRRMQTKPFQRELQRRAGIEATLSELVRAHGLRRHRYRGDAQRAAENLWKGAACNLKRLVRALLREPEPPAPLALAAQRPARMARSICCAARPLA